ncbi:hypothetical protein FHW75_004973 [Pseudomonas sp. OG7]|nr:hypothetical protein [Pseudomonas sp. OG7]
MGNQDGPGTWRRKWSPLTRPDDGQLAGVELAIGKPLAAAVGPDCEDLLRKAMPVQRGDLFAPESLGVVGSAGVGLL